MRFPHFESNDDNVEIGIERRLLVQHVDVVDEGKRELDQMLLGISAIRLSYSLTTIVFGNSPECKARTDVEPCIP